MYRLKVASGHYRIQHGRNPKGEWASTLLKTGDVFESEHDLSEVFANKFVRIDKEERNEVKYSPKKEEVSKGLNAVVNLTPPRVEEELKIGGKVQTESDYYRNGEEITVDFADSAKKHNLQIFKVKNDCYIFEAGKFDEPVNKRGVSFSRVEAFIQAQYE